VAYAALRARGHRLSEARNGREVSVIMKTPFVGAWIVVAVSVGLGAEACGQAQTLNAADPIKANEVPRRKKAAPLAAARTNRSRRRRAIRPSWAPTTTATDGANL
jgi:hypothetical protein